MNRLLRLHIEQLYHQPNSPKAQGKARVELVMATIKRYNLIWCGWLCALANSVTCKYCILSHYPVTLTVLHPLFDNLVVDLSLLSVSLFPARETAKDAFIPP